MSIAKWIIASLAVVLAVLFLYTWKLSQPIFDEKLNEQTLLAEIQTAPIDQALTFARYHTSEEAKRLLLLQLVRKCLHGPCY
jgi:hypothetical protein